MPARRTHTLRWTRVWGTRERPLRQARRHPPPAHQARLRPEAEERRNGRSPRGETRAGAIRASRRRFGALCVLAYVALSWAARFDMRRGEQIASLFYPL